MVIITNGTLMSIQNMTWNGKLGVILINLQVLLVLILIC